MLMAHIGVCMGAWTVTMTMIAFSDHKLCCQLQGCSFAEQSLQHAPCPHCPCCTPASPQPISQAFLPQLGFFALCPPMALSTMGSTGHEQSSGLGVGSGHAQPKQHSTGKLQLHGLPRFRSRRHIRATAAAVVATTVASVAIAVAAAAAAAAAAAPSATTLGLLQCMVAMPLLGCRCRRRRRPLSHHPQPPSCNAW